MLHTLKFHRHNFLTLFLTFALIVCFACAARAQTRVSPTISAVPVLLVTGVEQSDVVIANVSDADQPADTLFVTIDGGLSATQNGVTVTNLRIDKSGVVTADVIAAEGAKDVSFTLTVTNGTAESATATLPMMIPSLCPGAGFWSEQAHPTPSDGTAGEAFGYSVAISGETAVVGAFLGDAPGGTDAGAAYVYVRSGTVWTQQQKLTASDSASGDRFGLTVSISGDTLIIGADSDDNAGGTDAGSAYVFTRIGTVWSQQQKLTASDAAAADQFGYFVSISGETVVVGSVLDDNAGGTDAGSVYVFTRSGTVWSQQQKIAASDGAANDQFSQGSIDGDTIVVGVPLDDTAAGTNAGSVYVFTRSGSVWSQQQKLTASDGAASDFFGGAAKISGDTVVAAAYFDDTASGADAGSAYVFTRSGVVWTPQQKLNASDGAAGDLFSSSVAISGDTVVVGAYLDDTPGGTDAGSAYVFRRYGSFWDEEKKLTASDGSAFDDFGISAAIDGDTVVVGAHLVRSAYIFTRDCIPTISSVPVVRSPGAGVSNSTIANVDDGEQAPDTLAVIVNGGASATVNGVTVNNISVSPSGVVTADVVAAAGAADASFTLRVTDNTALSSTSTLAVIVLSQCPGTGTWNQQAHPTASDPAAQDNFGISVAVSGDTVIVGAENDDNVGGTNAGSAYVFTRSGTVWTFQQKLTASDGATDDFFGHSVAIGGDTVIVGANNDDNAGGTNAGSAYVFTRNGTVWTLQQKLTASDGAANAFFGYSVSISGDTVAVGAYNDENTAGSAYVFTRSGSVWTQQQKLTALDGANFDNFGKTVALSGDTVIVGADLDDTAAGTNAGSAYVFTRSGTAWSMQQKLTASDGATNDVFGISVAVSGDTVAVGASSDDTTGGLDAGSAYIFTRSGTVWAQQQKLTASDDAASDFFGSSVSISGDTVIVGAYRGDTTGGIDSGSAYVYVRSGTVWTEQQELTASDAAAFDAFGISVAISGDTVIVGAPFDVTAAGTGAGSAYVFNKDCPAPSITGTVTYGNAAAPPKFISNATVTGAGSPTVMTTTAAPGGTAGQYTLTGFGAGSYTVSLSKTTGQNGISSFDAGRIAQHVAGTLLLTTNNQKVSADVSNNGAVSSFDAGQIATFVATGSSPGIAGQWRFFLPPGPTFPIGASPTSRTYSSVTANVSGEDYVGLLIGEVTGNWNNTGARPVGGGAAMPAYLRRSSASPVSSNQTSVAMPPAAEPQNSNWRSSEKHSFSANRTAEPWVPAGPERAVSVELPNLSTPLDKEIIVPVNVEGVADKGIISYEFDLRYDPSVIQPLADPVDVAGTVSRGLSVVTNASEPGLLRVVVYGAMPIDGDGVLLNLRFTAVGAVGSVSPLTWERIMFNEGEPRVATADGKVELF